MKKLFISQPMRGKTDEQILAEREQAIKDAISMLGGEEVEVLSTYFGENNWSPLECLGKSICMLSYADIAYFAPGWKDARGCKIEHECAIEYDILTIEV